MTLKTSVFNVKTYRIKHVLADMEKSKFKCLEANISITTLFLDGAERFSSSPPKPTYLQFFLKH